MVFCDRNREFLNFACPEAGSLAVEPLPYQRETADAVKQARHCRMCAAGENTQAAQDVRPRRNGNAVAERPIPRTVRGFFVDLAFRIRPCADVRPAVREPLLCGASHNKGYVV